MDAPKCRKCGTPAPKPAPAPVWADPRALMAQTAVRFSAVEVSGGLVQQLLAPADPKRVSIGFSCGQNGQLWAGVTSDVINGGWAIPSGGNLRVLWFDLFTFGPLVNLEWYSSPGNQFVWVYEVYRLF